MLDRRHIVVVVLEGVVGVRVGGDDAAHAGGANGLRVMVAQGREQRLLAKPPDVVAAIPFLGAEYAEVLPEPAENAGGRPPDRLEAVVVGGDAVDEVKRVQRRPRRSATRTAPCAQSARFFSILPNGLPRLSSAFSGLCRDCGALPSSIRPRRKSTILSIYSTSSGHSASQAPQVVQDQISSSE